MARSCRPDSVVKAGWKLHSTLWGYARKEPYTARELWGRMYAMSLSLPLSRDARKRLLWFFDAATKFKGNIRKACRYHGISPKTFYYWRKRFDVRNPRSLEVRSHRPKYGPLPVLRPEQTKRIFELRSQYPRYSKMKIAVLYQQRYGEKVSSWQVQRVIERYMLYPDIKRARSIARKRKYAAVKQRIGKCAKNAWTGWLFSLDSITIYMAGEKVYILTAIDHFSRLLFCRAYKSHSSKAAADFLEQLCDFAWNKIQNIHTDNGSEFHDCFEQAAKRMGLNHWWSRVHTPKDNARNERVNRTIQEEFLPAYRFCTDLEEFNGGLVAWMMEYNQNRPHTALGYQTPYEVARAHPNPYPVFRDWENAASGDEEVSSPPATDDLPVEV
jgi:transposase InsO family protein